MACTASRNKDVDVVETHAEALAELLRLAPTQLDATLAPPLAPTTAAGAAATPGNLTAREVVLERYLIACNNDVHAALQARALVPRSHRSARTIPCFFVLRRSVTCRHALVRAQRV